MKKLLLAYIAFTVAICFIVPAIVGEASAAFFEFRPKMMSEVECPPGDRLDWFETDTKAWDRYEWKVFDPLTVRAICSGWWACADAETGRIFAPLPEHLVPEWLADHEKCHLKKFDHPRTHYIQ